MPCGGPIGLTLDPRLLSHWGIQSVCLYSTRLLLHNLIIGVRGGPSGRPLHSSWAVCIGKLWHPFEDIADFVRRRGQVAALQHRQTGQWSQRWFKRAVDWNEHLERPRNGYCWSSKLLHFRDGEWLIQRRMSLLPSDCASQWVMPCGKDRHQNQPRLRACSLV